MGSKEENRLQVKGYRVQIIPYNLSPNPNAQCPMPHAPCPMPHAQCPMPKSIKLIQKVSDRDGEIRTPKEVGNC
ncbi:MAG: hypothetical protein V7K98_11475 [Nostoc sp.]|uniref:hypothetical protein n=1 Tax=Nostoc sp. TaxID=1180 RepID=UPI002FFC2F33